MTFIRESDFESALIQILAGKGWESTVLENPTEEQLIQNWADILFENNRDLDRLNDDPLTEGEMRQILEQISELRTPLRLNGFINGKTVTIKRDNAWDTLHFGKEVSLKIYDRREIAAGQSRYQIVRQPRFAGQSPLLNDRRGDLMLLINGMPLIHIELKKSGIPVSQACNQIEKYAAEGLFCGIFSLIQVFVAMNPEETRYFANPGPDGSFNPDFFFHWADFNNEPIHDWKQIASTLLSIPMAHQLIGFYTVADDTDGTLKVMRSYQYFAANAISDRVSRIQWQEKNQTGGYIWHTTGSGKTMTSFKAAQLIASSKDADKVIFLMDRIELGTQSLKEYRGFAEESQSVQATENTSVLISKLKSSSPENTLIVTSIQKMSNIKNEGLDGLKAADLEVMQAKRLVFIVDECHRSTFGEMLLTIKGSFPRAVFFGFTGTPIQDENQKKKSTTAMIFGDELHRYSIADGIRDKNVLGFDPYKVLTYKDKDLRQVIALEKAKASSPEEALADPEKSRVFNEFMRLPMAEVLNPDGTYTRGIEDYLPDSQYETVEHQSMVIADIRENWLTLSQNGKFHAIFATSSICEAIQYYRRLRAEMPELKISALFDPGTDNLGHAIEKESGLAEIISDYNARYGQNFSIPAFALMKKDIASRLAHKKPYERVERSPQLQLDLLIVVDQMLTGFDSKWVNTLYLDKVLRYENVIQAFSRTNRLFGPEKPFGTIKYYRRPHSMQKNIEAAVRLYSGDKPLSLFVNRLMQNLKQINALAGQIEELFTQAGLPDLSALPTETSERKKFASLFKSLNDYLQAARIQGFVWQQLTYTVVDEVSGKESSLNVTLDEKTWRILALRYKELIQPGAEIKEEEIPYEIDGYLTTIDTARIDADYMNSRFNKYLKLLLDRGSSAQEIEQALTELHKTFASLSQEEQKYANIFLHDVQRGDVKTAEGKTFRDYVMEYMAKAKDDQIHRLSACFGLDESRLRAMMAARISENNINEFGRFDALKATVDKQKARAFFESREGKTIIPPRIPIKIDQFLRNFILNGGFDL